VTQPATTEPTAATELLEDLRDDISRHLTELGALLDLVHNLVDSRQSNLGFLTPDGRQALDELLRTERTQQHAHAHDGIGLDVGLRFLNRNTATAGTGDVPATVAVPAASVEAFAWAALQQLVTKATRHLVRLDPLIDADRGWCPVPKPVRDIPLQLDQAGAIVWPTSNQLVAHLRILCWDIAKPQLLRDTLRELEHLTGIAEHVVDGAGQSQLGECPHCGRNTLVVYFRGERTDKGARTGAFIRCGKDPQTGHHGLCTCGSEWCPCKRTPVSFRHTWWRNTRDAPDPRVAHDWHDLAGRLNIRRATKEPTDA
jgi:hypothetical protein